jgi:ribosomal protein L7/L12
MKTTDCCIALAKAFEHLDAADVLLTKTDDYFHTFNIGKAIVQARLFIAQALAHETLSTDDQSQSQTQKLRMLSVTNAGPNKAKVIRALRAINPRLTLEGATEFVEGDLEFPYSPAKAEAIGHQLEALGATVEIH